MAFRVAKISLFLHRHHFEVQFFMLAQRTNPCPLPVAVFLAADLREIS
jgi:hypothetical protein